MGLHDGRGLLTVFAEGFAFGVVVGLGTDSGGALGGGAASGVGGCVCAGCGAHEGQT